MQFMEIEMHICLLKAPHEACRSGERGRNWFTDVSEAFCRVSSDTECSQLIIEQNETYMAHT